MKTKLLLLFVCFTLLINTNANSQTKVSDEQKEQIQKQIKEDIASLGLTDDQKEPYKEITLKYGKQLQELKSSDEGKLAKYKKLKSIEKAKDDEMNNLLSDEQYKKYSEIQKKRRKALKEKRKKS